MYTLSFCPHLFSKHPRTLHTMTVLPPSSDMSGKVRETPAGSNCTGPGYVVEGSEELKYSYSFVDNVFDTKKDDLVSDRKTSGRRIQAVHLTCTRTCPL